MILYLNGKTTMDDYNRSLEFSNSLEFRKDIGGLRIVFQLIIQFYRCFGVQSLRLTQQKRFK